MYNEFYDPLLGKISFCAQKLNVQISSEWITKVGSIIHSCMSHPARLYHNIQHIFQVVEGLEDPEVILAGLFHDIVYLQVDNHLSESLNKWLNHLSIIEQQCILPDLGDGLIAKQFNLVCDVFGFNPGQKISLHNGLNEFLSALLAVFILSEKFTTKTLLVVAVSIFGTIPFQKKTIPSLFDKCLLRIQNINKKLHMHLSDFEIKKMMNQMVTLSNKDIAGFGSYNHSIFLLQTWQLLLESKLVLQTEDFLLKDYLDAVVSYESFFDNLDSNSIFMCFDNSPTEKEYKCLMKKADCNIQMAKIFLKFQKANLFLLDYFLQKLNLDISAFYLLKKINLKPFKNLKDLNQKAHIKEFEKILNFSLLHTDIFYESLILMTFGLMTFLDSEELKDLNEANFLAILPKDFVDAVYQSIKEI